MLAHPWLIATAIILLCAAVAGGLYHYSTLPTQLRLAVGPPNSEDAKLAQAIAAQFARDRSSVRLRLVQMDGGTRQTATAIDSGLADLAVVRSDIGMPRDAAAVAVWRKNVAVFIVPEPAKPPKPAAVKRGAAKTAAPKPAPKIEKIESLLGQRVGIVGRSQSNLDLLKLILRQYGIPPDKVAVLTPEEAEKPNAADKVSVVQFDPNNVAAAIRDSNVNAIFSVGPVSSPITAEAIAAATRDRKPPTFLAIDAAEAIAARNPLFESTEIKAGAFGGAPARPEESVETIGFNHYLMASKKLSENTIAELTKNLFAVRQRLRADQPNASLIEAPDTDKDATVPVHPGAAAYVDGEVKTFFDRYNDLLYWGLMIASLLGSAIAGMASYSKADDRARRLHNLDRLLELTKSAREALTARELDALQDESDNIFKEMIQEVESSSLDEAAVAAFSVAFDQVRHAIADRRAVLAEQPLPVRPAIAAV